MRRESDSSSQADEGEFRFVFATYRKALGLVIGVSFVINLLMLITPLYMIYLFRRLETGGDLDGVVHLAVIAVIALLFLALLEAARSVILMQLANWLDARLSERVLVAGVGPGEAAVRNALVQGLDDLATMRRFFTGNAISSVIDAPWALLFVVVILFIHPLLGLMVAIGAALVLAIAGRHEAGSRTLRELSRHAAADAHRQARATLRNVDAVGAMGMAPNVVRRWRTAQSETQALQESAGRRSALYAAVVKFVRYVVQVGAIAVGVWLVASDKMSIVAAIAGLFLMHRTLITAEVFAESRRPLREAREAFSRIQSQLTRRKGRFSRTTLPMARRGLLVTRVGYYHPGGSRPILQNIGFELQPGDVLALAGSMGAGKTTLCRLLVGVLTPSRGTIVFEGFRLEHWQPEALGRLIGYLPDHVQLFRGSIHDNIARMGDAKREEVVAAAELARAHDMIELLPAGYDTDVGEDGLALSSGQRQQIGLARAVFGMPALVVLDEPDSNLDKGRRGGLRDMINALRAHGIMTVVISHRESILRLGNKVGVLRDGELTLWSMSTHAGGDSEADPAETARVVSPQPAESFTR